MMRDCGTNEHPAGAEVPRYRGRLAPTPTGLMHLGHARTFGLAQQRADAASGVLVMRVEDLDRERCRTAFSKALFEDLKWWGLRWEEGPDVGGAYGPYTQSERFAHYHSLWRQLHERGCLYPSPHSRKDVHEALQAPHGPEPVFPVQLRPPPGTGAEAPEAGAMNWRFRVPDGEAIAFTDALQGPQRFVAGQAFGDFLVWRRDNCPAYELAVVADDHAMGITEVVRGADLLCSTARQLLLYRALGWEPPAWVHAPLLRDAQGTRLAKRAGALGLRALREAGHRPEALKAVLERSDTVDVGALVANL